MTNDTNRIHDLLEALADGKTGRQLPKKARKTLDDIDVGDQIAARGASNAELVDIAELLFDAIERDDVAQVHAVATGTAAVPGVPSRLLAMLGGFALAVADAAGLDWRSEIKTAHARMAVEDALGD